MRGRILAVFVAFCGLTIISHLFVRPQNGAMLHDLVPMVTSVSPNTISDHAHSSPEASQGLRSQSSATSERFGSTYAENETERLSLKESFGFLRYSDEQWLRLRKIHAAQKLRQHGKKSKEGHIYYQSNWEPTFSCAFEERIGKIGDGGKWVCDAYRIAESKVCNVVSVGSNGDWSFEEAMHKLNPRCKIFTFDHTTDGRGCPSFVSFHKIGLGVQDADVDSRGRGPIMSLSNMLKVAGLSNSTVDVFKIDCEGCERFVWPAFSQAFLGQILIELHGSSWNGSTQNVDSFFEAMVANGYVIFHKEPNTLGCRGNCIEYGFLKVAPSFHAQAGRMSGHAGHENSSPEASQGLRSQSHK